MPGHGRGGPAEGPTGIRTSPIVYPPPQAVPLRSEDDSPDATSNSKAGSGSGNLLPLFRFSKSALPSLGLHQHQRHDKNPDVNTTFTNAATTSSNSNNGYTDGPRMTFTSTYRARIPNLALSRNGRNRERISSHDPNSDPNLNMKSIPTLDAAPLSSTLAPRKALELRGEMPVEAFPAKTHGVSKSNTGKDAQNTDLVEPARTGAALPLPIPIVPQAYIPDPPMTFADRRRAESGPSSASASWSGSGDGGRTRTRLGMKGSPLKVWKYGSGGDDASGSGSGSGLESGSGSGFGSKGKARGTSTEPIMTSSSNPSTPVSTRRRRVEVQETDAERKRREMESVISWKVWAAACVASNAIPVDHDLLRPTHHSQPRPRSRHRPRLAVNTSGSKPMFDSSSTVSTEDIVSPITEDGTGWAIPGTAIRSTRGPIAALAGQKRPLSHSTSMGELHPSKGLPRNQSLPDMIAIEGERDGLGGPSNPVNRRRVGKLTPSSRSSGASRPSSLRPSSAGTSTPTPVAGPTNALLVLRPRLSNKNVREIALELVHALSAYTEIRTRLEETASGEGGTSSNTASSRIAWSRSALDRAREQDLLDPPTTKEALFQAGEIVALFRDLDETIGYPGYVQKMLIKAGYGIHDVVFEEDGSTTDTGDERGQVDAEKCDKILLDLEDLLWGRAEPLPDDIAYGHLILPTGKMQRRSSADGPGPNSSSLFDILAEPVPDALTDMNAHDFVKPFGASLFAEGPTRQGSVVYIPGVSTIDISSFVMPSSGRSSVDPHDAAAGRAARRESSVKVKTPEDLAREGRERYEAWQKSREVQPLKRS